MSTAASATSTKATTTRAARPWALRGRITEALASRGGATRRSGFGEAILHLDGAAQPLHGPRRHRRQRPRRLLRHLDERAQPGEALSGPSRDRIGERAAVGGGRPRRLQRHPRRRDVGEAVHRIGREGALQDRAQALGEAGEAGRAVAAGARQAPDLVAVEVAVEGLTREQLADDDAPAKQVGASVDGQPGGLLGRRGRRRPRDAVGGGGPERHDEVEVDEGDGAVDADDDAGGRDIAMHESRAVQGLQPVEDPMGDADGDGDVGSRAGPAQLPPGLQIDPLDEAGGDPAEAVVYARVDDVDDARQMPALQGADAGEDVADVELHRGCQALEHHERVVVVEAGDADLAEAAGAQGHEELRRPPDTGHRRASVVVVGGVNQGHRPAPGPRRRPARG
jgi:hypothetical protein